MTKQPIVIVRELRRKTEETIPEDLFLRYFAIEGYGLKRARYWLREYKDLGIIKASTEPGMITINV